MVFIAGLLLEVYGLPIEIPQENTGEGSRYGLNQVKGRRCEIAEAGGRSVDHQINLKGPDLRHQTQTLCNLF